MVALFIDGNGVTRLQAVKDPAPVIRFLKMLPMTLKEALTPEDILLERQTESAYKEIRFYRLHTLSEGCNIYESAEAVFEENKEIAK